MSYIVQPVSARFSIDSESGLAAIADTILLAGRNMTKSLNAITNELR